MSKKNVENEVTPQHNLGKDDDSDAGNVGGTETDVITKIQDRLEDIRDAIVETDAYDIVSKQATMVRNATTSVWNVSKRVAWIVGTSVLVLVVPLLYEVDKELGSSFDANSSNQSSSSSAPAGQSSPPSSTPLAAGEAQAAPLSSPASSTQTPTLTS